MSLIFCYSEGFIAPDNGSFLYFNFDAEFYDLTALLILGLDFNDIAKSLKSINWCSYWKLGN